MDTAEPDGESTVAPELYFLVAKFLSSGPLKETTEVLRKELEKCKILPKRLDWQGREHDQTFEELESQFPDVPPGHLLSVCEALLKTASGQPRKSLLCTSLYSNASHGRHLNFLQRIAARREGRWGARLLPAAVYGSLQLQRRTLGHLSAVYCVLFDRTGRYIITGADDLLVKVWSAVDGRLLGTLRGASAEITDMAVDTDNHLLAAGSLDRVVRVWDMQTSAPVAVLQGHNGMITSVHFCPARSGDLCCLVSTSTDGSVAFWTYSHSNTGKPCFISKPVQYVERMRPGACQMICGAWSPGGAFLAAGSADHHVRVYMMAENGPKRILETAAHCEAVDSLQWAHSGLRFVSGSKDGTAILWQLHAMQWRHLRLNMSDTLPGEKVDSEESKKMKVTMVGWDCTDSYVITAVNDCTLKVWCSQSGKLVRVLRGHTDEIYVLEAHPRHPAVLLSAGHDGQIFIWDILRGISLGSFQNHIEGQGPGAVYDAKWAPDGSKVAATDSHGHLLILGLGRGHPLLQKLPLELFFHTDYRPLMRDALGWVCDEQTGAPPHLMPPPFLVDVEGGPHPPPLQRLVPGREHAALDQLVPDTSAADMLEGEEPRSHINYMIEALARQFNDYHAIQVLPLEGMFALRPSRGEGVRHSAGEWQRGDPLVRSRRAMVAPLGPGEFSARRLYTEEMTQLEMSWYRREMRRRPVMISTAGAAAGAEGGSGARAKRGGARPRATPRRAPATRAYSEPPEEASSHHSDSDSSVRISVSDGSASNSSSSDHSENGGSSSSDYSDWVADQPNVPLRPPKRSKRKPIARQKYSPHPPADKKPSAPAPAPEVALPTDIPEAYRPSDWLCAVQPRKAPYHPQMGDECIYFKQGHARYVEAVSEKSEYKVGTRDMPWERLHLKESESVKVVGVKYMIRPPRLVCLKLQLDSGNHFTVRYHDMPDVLDFLVLRQTYETAAQRRWAPGDRFRCMIDDGWWMGAVVEGGGGEFLSLRVRWDNGEYERMSPWDLEPIDDTRLPTDVGGWVPVMPWELEAVLYRPREEEWPGGDRTAACRMIATGLDQVMLLAIAEPFVAPVDLSVYPTYAYVVEYPIDLSTVRARLENHFYRRVTSVQFDVRYLATNAEKFNLPHSPIVKQARVISDLCLQIISDPFDIDVQMTYHNLMNGYQSSDSDTPLAKHSSSRSKAPAHDWVSRCGRVLNGLFAAADSAPFRESVPVHQLPEYQQVVARPMDLGTVRRRLEGGAYSSPQHFAREVKLVFSNSKTYNTNKRSRIFSMTVRLESLFETLFRPVLRNWKASRRRNGSVAASGSSDDSLSEDSEHGKTGLQNGHSSTAGNGFHRPGEAEDSWDSDAPLRVVHPTYKGKGKGKRSQPTRSSGRKPTTTAPGTDVDGDGTGQSGPGAAEDSGDSYNPSRRDRRKKGKRKREPKIRRRSKKTKHSRRRPKMKRRKRSSAGGTSAESSSDTEVSVASGLPRRYESDHSFQLREPEPDLSDSDTPLGNMRRLDPLRSRNDLPSTSSLLRTRFVPHSDESRAGPSGSGGRSQRPARVGDSKRPRYNEDSEEDSIAAISKRLRQHQRPRTSNPMPSYVAEIRVDSVLGGPGPSHSRSWAGAAEAAPAGAPARAPSPLSVSSRGRVRKLTPKARGLLGD